MCIRDSAYTKASGNSDKLYVGNANPDGIYISGLGGQTNSWGLSAWWMPEESGWIPSVSTGVGMTYADAPGDDEESASWYVGLEWSDAFIAGNSLGMAVGQPTFDTDADRGAGYAWEFFYKFQVTDNISVTPAITYLSKPFPTQDSDGLNALSGLIKTQFKF